MKIAVCIKQVPSTNEVRLDPVTNTIIRDGRQSVTNPFDTYAVEAAVQIKEQLGGEVTVLSMGIPSTERLLRDACSRGADKGVLLSDRAFAGADTLATSYALSLWCRTAGLDLILCGKMAVDGDTAQIGPELAEHLGIPHITDVCEIMEIDEQKVKVRKQTARGFEILRTPLPALLTVVKDINLPRMASIPGVKAGMEADIRIYTAADLGADPDRCGLSGSPTQVVRTFTPQRSAEAVEITGATGDKAAKILEMLREVQ
ncbi:MAG: electron transfer flavoprotein subunit beta/FixA family protein [Clostridia bacterium]|nr:electron transfer flavoprotein subunit beta/FixA family protein [Clostridia bacterium]MBQ3091137.1 electron transfer flavoprotein subunit beta/FixA family protein [Clostridia bacterium]MBQ9924629.1 electron transfer flavoprotein subunit beta/FixA family protein [Clostridia bacterium]